MKSNYVFVIMVMILVYSCTGTTEPEIPKNEFGIFLLKDASLITSDVKKLSLESLKVDYNPIISIDDIVNYNWTDHSFTLTQDGLNNLNSLEEKNVSTFGQPFVVIVNQERIYLGNLMPAFSSYMVWDLPYITVAPLIGLRIRKAPSEDIEDKRFDDRIHNILLKHNKLGN